MSNFPLDENGDALRRMVESGDDLSQARNIDFTFVFPDDTTAHQFASHLRGTPYTVSVRNSGCVPELPWDVVVARNMVPDHAVITEFERYLAEQAAPLSGRNAGWDCFQV